MNDNYIISSGITILSEFHFQLPLFSLITIQSSKGEFIPSYILLSTNEKIIIIIGGIFHDPRVSFLALRIF